MIGFTYARRKSVPDAVLRVAGSDRTAPCAAGETLLAAAVRGQVPFPHMCNVGECGACKCRLTKGHVRLKKDISQHVSPEDLSSGFVLACQSMAESAEIEVEVPAQLDGTITRVTRLSPGVVALEIGLDAEAHYVAGQYARLSVPGVPNLSGPRCYSFAEAPDRASPRRALFHVRHVPGGAFTDWLFAADRTGTRLGFSGPHGAFRYHEAERPLLCVAGGTGLSPIKAILEQALSDGLTRDVTLAVGARTERDLYARDAVASLKERWRGRFDVVPVLSQEPAGSAWRGRRGHVTDYLREIAPSLAEHAAYVCGPPAMIDAALDVLRERIPPEHVHHDRFLDRGSVAASRAA
jgi:CDP-4-dehydro-6-deoxyglucose reductase